MEADVVIVGAGAAGIAAGVSLAEAGDKVIMLEKGDKFGGAGMFGAQGLFAVESAQQRAAGVEYTIKQAYQELTNYTHYRSNLGLVKAILEESASTIDWLGKRGLKTELVNNTQEVHQGHPKVYHQYIDKFAGFDRLMQNFKSHGGRLLLKTTGTKLIQTDDQISGIQVHQEKQDFIIECSAVVVADGGFIGNQDLVKSFLTIDPTNLYSMGERKATGDGIKMLAELGADTRHMGVFENHAASVISPQNHKWHNETIFSLTNLPFLWVDGAGKRFVDESVCYDFALWGNATYTAGGYYYIILDQQFVDYISEHSLNWTDSFERTFASLSHKQVTHKVGPFPQIDADLEEAIQKEAGWRAETLDELADQIHVSRQDFEKTIQHYNSLVNQKEDTDFYKPNKYLQFSLAKGPFYAIKARSTSLGTIGGIETNAKLEALKQNKQPIKGAYVTGNDASGMYDTSYPTLEGISCAFAWNSGRLAAKSVIQFLNKFC
ncbi:FAD-dependent oxidoreductase [Pediococcus ethanolidurans]|uniref:FAD-dependent oxidoreductase n=1 Tax=Pediococcus ethanolidurans TaxID=319653 RepID=UPI0021E776C3|nr:FAD-dependent oxidoreductase [Pediococcus ethanolidurans]MCV3327193.1 FAD-dependent oxidoreductase [Pediococcus ethanolidurans]